MYEWNPFSQLMYLIACTTLTRFMYYHAWILADAVCNASGLGFNGYDKNGNPKWDITQNVDIFGFEVCFESVQSKQGDYSLKYFNRENFVVKYIVQPKFQLVLAN